MILVKCIQKFRDKNNIIYGYKLQDQQGKIIDIKPEELKNAIRSKQIDVVNLKLTTNGRLVDKNTKNNQPKKDETQQILLKARTLGMPIESVEVDKNGGKIYFIHRSQTDHVLIIGNDIRNIRNLSNYNYYHILGNENYLCQNIIGHLKVIGGSSLQSTAHMFSKCKAKSIDLSSFDTSKVTEMKYMFEFCQAESINLSNLDTRKVVEMQYMFACCKAKSIDVSKFNTNNVKNMQGMFEGCHIETLDLLALDTSKVKDMSGMFADCEVKSLDLSGFSTSKVEDMSCMFEGCETKSINLSNFDTSKVTNMYHMFANCKVQSLNLLSFDTSHVEDMTGMFNECEADSIDLSSFNTNSIKMDDDIDYIFYDCHADIKVSDIRLKDKLNNS